jgi:rubrerythrin
VFGDPPKHVVRICRFGATERDAESQAWPMLPTLSGGADMRLAVVTFLLCGVMWPMIASSQGRHRATQTIKNLSAAIEGEANASHRYALFARRADEEGYAQVAKLFRAAALAESIHQRNHENVLRDLGVEPERPKLADVKVGTTRENLEVPIKGESKEQEEMYPAMVKQALREDVPEAVTSFTYALNTEGEHARLFRDALAQLGHNRPVDYYVGETSGDTVTKPTQKEAYRKVE